MDEKSTNADEKNSQAEEEEDSMSDVDFVDFASPCDKAVRSPSSLSEEHGDNPIAQALQALSTPPNESHTNVKE